MWMENLYNGGSEGVNSILHVSLAKLLSPGYIS